MSEAAQPLPLPLSDDQERALAAVLEWYGGPKRRLTLGGLAGTGKALPCDELVQTPEGPREIGDLRVGDAVFGLDGAPVSVTGVFPQGMRQSWRVGFRDKSHVDCDDEHLWSVWTIKRRQKRTPPIVKSLREMREAGVKLKCGLYRHSVPLCEPVQYETRDLPVAPYLLGLLIGDGTSLGKTPTLCIPDLDASLVEAARKLLPSGFEVRTGRAPSCPQHRLVDTSERGNRLSRAMRSLGLDRLSPARFVPRVYLQGDVSQRWELLRGLMDTDGSCVKNRTTFSTTSDQLVRDIVELTQSLGGTAIPSQQKRGEWQVNIKTFECPFSLPRKAARWSPSWKNPPSRFITSISPSRVCAHVCISVDSPDGIFLARDFVATHNTTLIKRIVERLPATVCAYTGKAASVLRQKGVEAQTLHSLIYQPFSVCRRCEEYVDFVCMTCGKSDEVVTRFGRIQQIDASLVIVDEASMLSCRLVDDLEAYGIYVLYVGDHGQLEPIGPDPGIMRAPEILLEQIHRQARGNAIIEFAHHVRAGSPPRSFAGGPEVEVGLTPKQSELSRYDVVLCGLNKTRVAVNAMMREQLGFSGPLPSIGERVICLQNDRELGVYNGMIAKVADVRNETEPWLELATDTGERLWLPVLRAQFGRAKRTERRRGVGLFDFGYCVTCHKSQGSEFDTVAVLEQIAPAWDASRWRYTAATRARKQLHYFAR